MRRRRQRVEVYCGQKYFRVINVKRLADKRVSPAKFWAFIASIPLAYLGAEHVTYRGGK